MLERVRAGAVIALIYSLVRCFYLKRMLTPLDGDAFELEGQELLITVLFALAVLWSALACYLVFGSRPFEHLTLLQRSLAGLWGGSMLFFILFRNYDLDMSYMMLDLAITGLSCYALDKLPNNPNDPLGLRKK